MTPEETNHYNYINGKDLDRNLCKTERLKILHARRRKIRHRYGGEPVTEIDTLNDSSIPCFSSDDDLSLSRKKLD